MTKNKDYEFKNKISNDYKEWKDTFIKSNTVEDIFDGSKPYDLALVTASSDFLSTIANEELVEDIITLAKARDLNVFDFIIEGAYNVDNTVNYQDYRALEYLLNEILEYEKSL